MCFTVFASASGWVEFASVPISTIVGRYRVLFTASPRNRIVHGISGSNLTSPVTMHSKTLSSKVMAMTLSEDTLFQGFSCPTEAFYESPLHLVAVQYARADLEVFVESSEAELRPYARSTIAPFGWCLTLKVFSRVLCVSPRALRFRCYLTQRTRRYAEDAEQTFSKLRHHRLLWLVGIGADPLHRTAGKFNNEDYRGPHRT